MKRKHVPLKLFSRKDLKKQTSFHHKKPFSYLGDSVLMTTQASNMGPSDVPPWG